MFGRFYALKKRTNLQVCPLAIMRPVVDRVALKLNAKNKIKNKDKEQKHLRIHLKLHCCFHKMIYIFFLLYFSPKDSPVFALFSFQDHSGNNYNNCSDESLFGKRLEHRFSLSQFVARQKNKNRETFLFHVVVFLCGPFLIVNYCFVCFKRNVTFMLMTSKAEAAAAVVTRTDL